MWSKSNRILIGGLATAAFCVAIAGGSVAGGGEIEETPEIEAICQKAEKRYADIAGDLPSEDGVVVVKMHKYTFCPPNLTVPKGTTVRWVNVDKRTSHSVWLKDAGVAESERFFPEEIWEHTFTEDGDYPYLCGPHWEDDDMRGFVKVVE